MLYIPTGSGRAVASSSPLGDPCAAVKDALRRQHVAMLGFCMEMDDSSRSSQKDLEESPYLMVKRC